VQHPQQRGSANQGVHGSDSPFEATLSIDERKLLDDYELQLAMALSLSVKDVKGQVEEKEGNLIDFDAE
jgi:hypothetical protein